MKVKVLLNIGANSGLPPLKEGEQDVPHDVGLRLIERGWGVSVAEPAKPIKAVPPPATVKAEKKSSEPKPANKEQ